MKLPTFKYWLRLNKYPPPLFWDGREAQSHTPERLLGAGCFKEPGTTGEKIISKNIWSMKNLYGYLQRSRPRTTFLILGCVAIFMSTYPANAANIGYQPLADCCASKVGDRSWSNMGEGNLSSFLHTYLFSRMTKNEKKTRPANNSSRACPPTERNTVSNAAVRPRVITHHFREATNMIPPAAAGGDTWMCIAASTPDAVISLHITALNQQKGGAL